MEVRGRKTEEEKTSGMVVVVRGRTGETRSDISLQESAAQDTPGPRRWPDLQGEIKPDRDFFIILLCATSSVWCSILCKFT